MFTNQTLKREKVLKINSLLSSEKFFLIQKEKFSFIPLKINSPFVSWLSFSLRRQFNFFKKEIRFSAKNSDKSSKTLHIEISSKKMNELLEQQKICAADIRCLDVNSKQCLKLLCLKTCLHNTKYSNSQPKALSKLPLPIDSYV
ncbi:MAG: hypothetical protein KAH20_03315 [Methylococcales bacterium]|nr:hypothetical protein [Methylococcales bacterium]